MPVRAACVGGTRVTCVRACVCGFTRAYVFGCMCVYGLWFLQKIYIISLTVVIVTSTPDLKISNLSSYILRYSYGMRRGLSCLRERIKVPSGRLTFLFTQIIYIYNIYIYFLYSYLYMFNLYIFTWSATIRLLTQARARVDHRAKITLTEDH